MWSSVWSWTGELVGAGFVLREDYVATTLSTSRHGLYWGIFRLLETCMTYFLCHSGNQVSQGLWFHLKSTLKKCYILCHGAVLWKKYNFLWHTEEALWTKWGIVAILNHWEHNEQSWVQKRWRNGFSKVVNYFVCLHSRVCSPGPTSRKKVLIKSVTQNWLLKLKLSPRRKVEKLISYK